MEYDEQGNLIGVDTMDVRVMAGAPPAEDCI